MGLEEMGVRKVLLIDDHQDSRTRVHRLFESWGFTVVSSSSPEMAIPLAESDPPDLICLNLSRFRHKASAMCRTLKQSCPKSKVFCIVEGRPTAEDEKLGREAGAVGVIAEPKDQSEFLGYLQAEGESYRVTCPECQTSFRFHGQSVDGSRVKVKCPQCHYLFGVLPDEMEPASAAPPRQEGAKILVVEDTEFFRVYLKDLLTDAGFQVTTVKDGMEALERLGAERPDLVVTDLLMPRLNGFELCRKIKDHPATASLPVIMMTEVYTKKHYQAEAQQDHRADDFLTKPFHPEDLLARIRRLIPRSSP
jgi:predicted Zn finger-like uncharacterized protein